MKPYYDDGTCRIYLGDCRDVMAAFPPCFRVDHVITDPPYARDVYVRLSHLSVPAVGKQGRPIHDLQNGALARMVAEGGFTVPVEDEASTAPTAAS